MALSIVASGLVPDVSGPVPDVVGFIPDIVHMARTNYKPIRRRRISSSLPQQTEGVQQRPLVKVLDEFSELNKHTT